MRFELTDGEAGAGLPRLSTPEICNNYDVTSAEHHLTMLERRELLWVGDPSPSLVVSMPNRRPRGNHLP